MEEVKVTKRILAYLIDVLLLFFLIGLISGIKFINPWYDKYVSTYNKYSEVLTNYYNREINEQEMIEQNKNNFYYLNKYSVPYNIVTIIVLFGYFVIFQKFNNGQTLGKKIMKIKVTTVDNTEVSLGKYSLRILPIYFAYVGSVLPILINTILIYCISPNYYMVANSIVTYIFIFVGIVTLVTLMVRKDKRGLHDLLANTKIVKE